MKRKIISKIIPFILIIIYTASIILFDFRYLTHGNLSVFMDIIGSGIIAVAVLLNKGRLQTFILFLYPSLNIISILLFDFSSYSHDVLSNIPLIISLLFNITIIFLSLNGFANIIHWKKALTIIIMIFECFTVPIRTLINYHMGKDYFISWWAEQKLSYCSLRIAYVAFIIGFALFIFKNDFVKPFDKVLKEKSDFEELEVLYKEGKITEEEYQAKRKEIINSIVS